MEISGNWLNAEDKHRLDEWQKLHSHTFKGFLVDTSLPPGNFRTFGEVLYLSSDIIRRMQESKIPTPEME